MNAGALLHRALRAPEALAGLAEAEWDLLIRLGRRAQLLARLAETLAAAGSLDAVPEAPRRHLTAARLVARRQDQAVRYEVDCIAQALARARTPLVLLKGAAYLLAGLPAARGRSFADVDILVPKERLGPVEGALMLSGWQSTVRDAYDQRYYRRWMHELPPMRHVERGSAIDVHHAIVPESARLSVDTAALFQALRPVPGLAGAYTLQPLDMVLHSAAHLFQEGELDKGLRDLCDLDSLLRHFGAEPGFFEALLPRARALGLARPLHYALRYATGLLGTPLPEDLLAAAAADGPAAPVRRLMDFCYRRALRPNHASCDTRGTALARGLLYLRAHWLRMPLPLLLPHLARKALARPETQAQDEPFAVEAEGPGA